MTSLNATVIGARLIISLFVQRLLAEIVGEAGIAKIGSLRNLTQLLTSFSSIGIFNGIVKYVAEYKTDGEKLQKLFSTTLVFSVLGTVATGFVLFFGASFFSEYLFATNEFGYLIKLIAVTVPFICLQRVFSGVINGLSEYKKYAKIDLISYVISAGLTVWFLLEYNIDGALVAIALTPIIQLIVLLVIFFSVLKEYIRFSELSFKIPMAKSLLAFSMMSFFSTVLLNYVEIDIRSMITNKITQSDAGVWTAMTFISKNYMVFSGSILTLYVLPKFSGIYTETEFKKELFNIFRTLLPLFGLGMILVYLFRNLIIQLIYPDFVSMAPLFKWQLLGDFVRLASIIIAHQFLAKKMVRNFIFSEVISLGLFFGMAYWFTDIYGIEGVVIAHFIRYIFYFFIVTFLVWRYFKNNRSTPENVDVQN